jgi:TonB family protein
MFCGECGKESVEAFKFCPNCGKPVRIESVANEPVVPDTEIPESIDLSVGQDEESADGVGGTGIRAGTFAFAALSVISLLVSISKGLVPIYLLEACAWAGAAWYWQSKRIHSEAAKAVVTLLAVLVAVGEVIHIAVQANPQPSPAPAASESVPPNAQKRPDLSDLYGPQAQNSGDSRISASSACPISIPSGDISIPLKPEHSKDVVGTGGSLSSSYAYDGSSSRLWEASLDFANRTNTCVTMATADLELNYGGRVSRERHSIVFQPILGPGQIQSVSVDLRIRTPEHGEEVGLSGWRTVSASGIPVESDERTDDENGFQIIKGKENAISTNSDHETQQADLNAGPSQIANLSGDEARRRLIQKTLPVYPPIARAARVSGTVVLSVTISETGIVERIKVVSGSPMLQQAALEAVKNWRYRPYVVNNSAVKVHTYVNVEFSLTG